MKRTQLFVEEIWPLAIYNSELSAFQTLHLQALQIDTKERIRNRLEAFRKAVRPFNKLRRRDQDIVARSLYTLFQGEES